MSSDSFLRDVSLIELALEFGQVGVLLDFNFKYRS